MKNEMTGILEQVLCLYQRYGIRSVTMDDVAGELGISKKTLYRQVRDKADLVEKAFTLLMEKRSLDFLEKTKSARNAIEEILMVNRCVNEYMHDKHFSMEYDLKKYYPAIYSEMMEQKRRRMYESMMRNLERGKREGFYRTEMDPDKLAKLYVIRMESIEEDSYLPVSDFTSPEFFNEIFEYHIRGVANARGIEYYEKNISQMQENLIKEK